MPTNRQPENTDEDFYFRPQPFSRTDEAYFDPIPERTWPAIEDPQEWAEDWPFAAEIALWLISESERQDAQAHEIRREQARLRGKAPLKPWLTLNKGGKAVARRYNLQSEYNARGAKAKALQPLSVSQLKLLISNMQLAASRSIAKWLSSWNRKEPLPIQVNEYPDDYAKCIHNESGSKLPLRLIALRISRGATKKEAVQEFKEMLDDLEKRELVKFESPLKKHEDALNNLGSLALYRLHEKAPDSQFWKPLNRTKLRKRTDAKDPVAMRRFCKKAISHFDRTYLRN
jgi:hypothetical protein